MRWNIENSFDYLKEHGYNLGHKFSRVSFRALKNYHQSMLLGHLINQFVEKSLEIVSLLAQDSKNTIIHLWKRLNGYFCEQEINTEEYDQFVRKQTQIRLAYAGMENPCSPTLRANTVETRKEVNDQNQGIDQIANRKNIC